MNNINYTLMNELGLGNVDISIFFIVLAAVCVILFGITVFLLVTVIKMKARYKKFMTGKNGKNLEKDIIALHEDNNIIKTMTEKNKDDISSLNKRFKSAYQKVGLVKYDAFNQMGGNLSFCIALLDGKENGFILNSVHSSEGCYSYSKEIKHGECDISLGAEEQKALEMAKEVIS